MNRFNKKTLAFMFLILLGAGVVAFFFYRSKTAEVYNGLEEARANAFFVRKLRINVHELESQTLLDFENLERLQISFHYGEKNKEKWAKIRLPPGLKVLILEGVPEPIISTLTAQVAQLEMLNVSCELTDLSLRNTKSSVFSLSEYKYLRKLELSLCSYERLSTKAGEVTRLESIAIAGRNFKRLPADILRLRNLKRLTIDSATFEKLPSGVHKLKALEEVALRYTLIEKPLMEFRRLPELESFILFGPENRKHVISLEIKPGDFPALKRLWIGRYKIRKLKGLERLRNLKDLDLSPLSLNKSQTIWSFPPGLQRLELSGMKLRKVPPGIGDLTELQHLDLSDNCLTDLPPEFRRLKKLTLVNLRDNGIRGYPESLLKSPELGYTNNSDFKYYKRNCRR